MTLDWYRIGDGSLGIDSGDHALRDRFRVIFGECRTPDATGGPVVVCRAVPTSPAGQWRIEFDDPEPLDTASFVTAMFPDRDIRFDGNAASSGYHFTLDAETIVAAAESDWQPIAANIAVNRLLRLQRGCVFFHAASVDVCGTGVLACGPKRAGKTTLATALAHRGHSLLGDELAALKLVPPTLLPCRRSLAVREGPAGTGVHDAIVAGGGTVEQFPDGEARTRVGASVLSANASPAPLGLVVLLRSFADAPSVERVPVSPVVLGALTPMAASLWQRTRPQLVMQLLRALANVPVFWLDAGTPDDTAALIERLVEEGCR